MSSPKWQATSTSGGVTPRDPPTVENSNPNAVREGGNSHPKDDSFSNGAAAVPLPDASNGQIFPAAFSNSNSNSNSILSKKRRRKFPPRQFKFQNSNSNLAKAPTLFMKAATRLFKSILHLAALLPFFYRTLQTSKIFRPFRLSFQILSELLRR